VAIRHAAKKENPILDVLTKELRQDFEIKVTMFKTRIHNHKSLQ